MLPRPSCLGALFAALVVLSCSDSTAPRGEPGIRIVAGAGTTDTVYSFLTQALVVEVRDSSGHLVPEGTIVRFQAAVENFTYETMVGKLTDQAVYGFVALETDQSGRAAALVRLGPKAGPARVVIHVATLGMVDTASYTVLPGNPYDIRITPGDTMLYVGNSYTLSARVVDTWGNERDDDVTWSATGGGVAVSNAGAVTASAVGRYVVTGTAGTLSRTAAVSVVPQYRLVAWQIAPTSSIVSMNLDGTDKRVLASVIDGGIGAHPQWIPGTATAIYSTLEGSVQRLRVVDENGTSSPFMPTTAGITHQAEPAPSADGNWVFFGAFNEACNTGDYCVNRATSAGASPAALETSGARSRQPAPSPDGSLVAFVRDPFFPIIQVMNAAGQVQDWAVTGSRPSWSPQGTKIAFVKDGRIATINPDGSGEAVLTPSGNASWSGPIRWSPDGAWIIARVDGLLALLQVANGAVLPLPGSAALHGGSVR